MRDNCLLRQLGNSWGLPGKDKGSLTQSVSPSRRGTMELLREQEQVFSHHIHFLKIEFSFCEKPFCTITPSLWLHQPRHERRLVACYDCWMHTKIPYLLVMLMMLRIRLCEYLTSLLSLKSFRALVWWHLSGWGKGLQGSGFVFTLPISFHFFSC